MVAGFLGVHTGYKEGKFSLSANGRYPGNITQEVVNEHVAAIGEGAL